MMQTNNVETILINFSYNPYSPDGSWELKSVETTAMYRYSYMTYISTCQVVTTKASRPKWKRSTTSFQNKNASSPVHRRES
jgi:hypothetical protein